MLAVLGGFVVLIVVVAFMAAFRNTGGTVDVATRVRLDAEGLRDGEYRAVRANADVVLVGQEYRSVDLYVVRVKGHLHALWARSTHLGCRTVPRRDPGRSTDGGVFEDPCGGSLFALDGTCVSGPCPRSLDEFAVVERNGIAYADLARVLRGRPRAT
ncbi:MAG: cytochrome b6-f complex iron-sulfur subunit [Actinomycetota bacterium]|nr:cytochrome b6-f complex iron-sulfur subunit [Actinomycetota bacterium]